jgi:hypothetical protein
MEPGAPLPTLKASDRSELRVSYFEASTEVHRRVILRFTGCSQFIFGYPNDESLPGHPLYQFGLGYYGLFEVRGSDWGHRLRTQNLVSFPRTDLNAPDGRRHFVVTFHDQTLECLARGIEGRLIDDEIEAQDGSTNEWLSF